MPQFAYIASRKIEDLFIDRGLSMGSLVYDGRLIVPTDVEADDVVFRNVQLLQGRTDMAVMLPGRKMKFIEDVNEKAVPVTTDLDGSVKGAQKHAQLGQDAMEKILEAATQDLGISDRAFVIFFETSMLDGVMFDAFLEKRPG